ncbi:hypothetical protein DEA8626_00622 [Defluviimonas aquaemixtae]|uniref:EamA domain-containing protein n=1 Tax=Albidovulum aquaemixtae TaxID=1542388 RepID=A0A2R8B3E1_9RHOB|nr:DMT family transporter [Defluviimonas aquaemixtae]SPH17107.1 hypothetical protein DEA8626_00622 [Defluviimonas aquaemixtae]
MADATNCAGALPCASGPGLAAPFLLVSVGSLIATAVMLSKLAAAAGAPMLGYLGAVWFGAAGLLFLPLVFGRGPLGVAGTLHYGLGAGFLMIVPSAMGYLAVAHVGAGYISLTFAFPVLLTWLIARGLRMDGARPGQGAGVLAGLAGGVLLASAKLAGAGGPGGSVYWVMLATAIPVTLALGNIFRTRYWPAGARPLPLAAFSVLAGALMVLPFAALTEGGRLSLLWQSPELAGLTAAGAAVVAAQYVLQFRLQALAGPVYMSQIGGVAAMTGAVIAVVALGETLPPMFWPAALMIAAGTVLFHNAAAKRRR